MTDELIKQLGRLHPAGLLVIARTSVMRYKTSQAPLDQIARELGVAYVLEGSARREAGRVRISAELIQAQNQTQIWADTFERELSGIFALQSEVAKQVVNALALHLLPAEQARFANVKTVDPEAYDAYLKGVRAYRSITKPSLESALARPRHKRLYGRAADLASLPAAYTFGIVRDHPYTDGNKRVGLLAMLTFLAINGRDLEADDEDVLTTVLALAAGRLTEAQLAAWVRARLIPLA